MAKHDAPRGGERKPRVGEQARGMELAQAGQEPGAGEYQNEKSAKLEQSTKLRQEFKLGEHEVKEEEKVKEGYVSLITGSVDEVEFSEKGKDENFYTNDVAKSCRLLLDLYKSKKDVFTKNAAGFIESNMKALEAIDNMWISNEKGFGKLYKQFSREQINGPDGVLQLLLAFNRVVSKLPEGAVENQMSKRDEQHFKIDLRHHEGRAVEVTLYNPEITDPDIGKLSFDEPTLRVEKSMKTSGEYEVTYYSGGATIPKYILTIDPKQKTIVVTRNSGISGKLTRVTRTMTFSQFDNLVRIKPYFLYEENLNAPQYNYTGRMVWNEKLEYELKSKTRELYEMGERWNSKWNTKEHDFTSAKALNNPDEGDFLITVMNNMEIYDGKEVHHGRSVISAIKYYDGNKWVEVDMSTRRDESAPAKMPDPKELNEKTDDASGDFKNYWEWPWNL